MRGCRPITDSEIQAVSAALSIRDRALFLTGIRTGYRISELLSLRVCDVWDGQAVRSAIGVRSASMKGSAPTRCVALHAEAREALQAWLNQRETDQAESALFSSRKGGALDRKSAWRILSKAFKAAGVTGLQGQLGTHCMRKTFAAKVYDRLGHDLIKTQRALGHKSILSTAQYLSFDESEITAAILAA
jgi:integrase